MFTGIRTDYNKDIRHYFGQSVQTLSNDINNSMNERTNECIALSPDGDKDKSSF